MNNKIPVATLQVDTLIRECSLGKVSDATLYQILSNSIYQNHIHEIFGYRRFGYDFCDTLTIYNDKEHIIGSIKPSYDDFLYDVLHSLGIKINQREIEDNELLTEEMLEHLAILRNVKDERELKEKFPMLYHDLTYGRGRLMAARELDRTKEENEFLFQKETKYCYSCGIKYNFERFLDDQCRLYTRFIIRRGQYKESIEKSSYNKFLRDYFNIDKVMLYTVYEYLKKCESLEDKEKIEEYLHYVDIYKKSNYDKNVSITTNDNVVVSQEVIDEKIKKIHHKLNEKTPLYVEWEILPRGSRVVSKEKNGKIRETLFNQEEYNRLRKLGERKEEFYENTPYLEKVIGLMKYKGYIAYIYPDGVLVDTKYDSNHPKTATGNAIYYFPAKDFEELSYHTKSFLQEDERVERIIHSPHWEEKVKKVAFSNGTEETREDAKQLIKKLQEKRPR